MSQDTLLKQPGMNDLRSRLLKKGLNAYLELTKEYQDNPDLQGELARTYFYIGQITEQTDEGDLTAAQKWYLNAHQIQEDLYKKQNDLQLTEDLGNTISALGRIQDQLGNREAAREYFDSTLQLRQKLVKTIAGGEQQLKHNRALADTYMNIGLVERSLSHFDSAEEFMKKAQDLRYKDRENLHTLRDLWCWILQSFGS